MLDAEPLDGYPVLVLCEPIQEYFDITTIDDVEPYLWRSEEEVNWDLYDFNQSPPPWQGLEDEDENGYAGDAYGFNFISNKPNFILGDGSAEAGHGRNVTLGAVNTLVAAEGLEIPDVVNVRIMYVVTQNFNAGSAALDYILDRQASGVNIVAIGAPPAFTNYEGASLLADAGIMLIGGNTTQNINFDGDLGDDSSAFYTATPRFGVQETALDNVMPIATDPRQLNAQGNPILRGHGINSYYGGVATYREESFSGPAAAAIAAVAVQAYQEFEPHDGEEPSIRQIKSAMLSGMDYISNLNNRTISHDYVSAARAGGGLFDLESVAEAINDSPDITSVSITGGTPSGTTVPFSLGRIGSTPTNWTISWGDNSGEDQSGIEVLLGAATSASHPFPRDIQPHTYYPTIYAMLGTGNGRRVYVPTAAAQAVVIDTNMDPTSGKDEYTLSRDGDDLLVELDNGNGHFEQTFDSDDLPRSILYLGAGGDTVTIDFSNGDPLEHTDLLVRGTAGQNNVVFVIGRAIADVIQNYCTETTVVNGTSFMTSTDVDIHIDAGGGNDDILSTTARDTTILGGAGNDEIETGTNRGVTTVLGGDGIDTVVNLLGPDGVDQDVEYYAKDESNIRQVKRYDAENDLLFSLTQTIAGGSAGATTINLETALTAIDVDISGATTLAFHTETVPVNTVSALVLNGQNKNEYIDVEAGVNVTVNAAGGDDEIGVRSPNASIDGGSGNDTIWTGSTASTGYYFVKLGTGTNTFNGGNGIDYVQLASGATDTIYLGGGNDIVDALYDFGDNDYLDGGAGTDTLKIYEGLERTNLISIEEIDEIPWPG